MKQAAMRRGHPKGAKIFMDNLAILTLSYVKQI